MRGNVGDFLCLSYKPPPEISRVRDLNANAVRSGHMFQEPRFKFSPASLRSTLSRPDRTRPSAAEGWLALADFYVAEAEAERIARLRLAAIRRRPARKRSTAIYFDRDACAVPGSRRLNARE
jgi:hypothetical protein